MSSAIKYRSKIFFSSLFDLRMLLAHQLQMRLKFQSPDWTFWRLITQQWTLKSKQNCILLHINIIFAVCLVLNDSFSTWMSPIIQPRKQTPLPIYLIDAFFSPALSMTASTCFPDPFRRSISACSVLGGRVCENFWMWVGVCVCIGLYEVGRAA